MGVVRARGDLFKSEIRALAHGCNCAGAMGKGIAVEFKRRWPAMYEEYHRRCKNDEFVPGDVFYWSEPDRGIFNLGTQSHWRTKATLADIETSMTKMIKMADEMGINCIAMPAIGAGLGGLALEAVMSRLRQIAEPWQGELWVCVEFRSGEPLEAIE